MKRYVFSIFFLLLLFSIIQIKEVSADMGPKPSLKITVIGIDEPYYFDLLSAEGVPKTLDAGELSSASDDYYANTYPSILNAYQDTDDFSSYFLYGVPSSLTRTDVTTTSQIFEMNYYPPNIFKIILVTENGKLIVSEKIERFAFDTEIVYDLSGVDTSVNQTGVGTITGNISSREITLNTISRTAVRVLYTLIIEIGILFLFKFRTKRSYIIVGITNLVTQIGLNYIVINTAVRGSVLYAIILLLILEVVVLVVESITYFFLLKERSTGIAVAYAFVANIASFLIGFFLLTSI